MNLDDQSEICVGKCFCLSSSFGSEGSGFKPAGVLEKVEPVVPNAFAHFVQNNTGTSIRPENYSATFKGDLGIPEHNALNLSKLHLIDLTNLPVTSVAEPSTLIDLFTSIIRNFYFYS